VDAGTLPQQFLNAGNIAISGRLEHLFVRGLRVEVMAIATANQTY
jgi:hypothetical protein